MASGSTNSSQNPVQYGADVNNLISRLNANMQTLESVGQKQQQQDTALAGFEARFQSMENGLKGHGAILTSLATAQERQGDLMSSLNKKMDDLTQIINAVTQQSQQAKQALASNPPQGAP